MYSHRNGLLALMGLCASTGLARAQQNGGNVAAPLAPPALAPITNVAPAAAPPTLTAPIPLIANGNFAAPLPGTWTVSGKVKTEARVVEAHIEGAPQVTHALQIGLEAVPEAQPWSVRLDGGRSLQPLGKNEMVAVQFWARSTLKTHLSVIFQSSSAPFEKLIRQDVAFFPQWRRLTFYAPASKDYGAGQTNFELQVGQTTGTVEVADFAVQNYGAITLDEAQKRLGNQTIDYYGMEQPNDDWIPAALARIEKYRKADAKIQIVNSSGKPISGALVSLNQTRSAFHWGTAVNYRVLEQSSDGEAYRAQLKRLFNTAVLENDLKWVAVDGNPGLQKRGRMEVDWLQANGLAIRGHNIVWGSSRFLPARVKDLAPDELRAEVEKRVSNAMTPYKGQLYVWDVVNEAGKETELWDKIGWQTFPDVYKWARAADPGALLAYNDYNISNEAPDGGALRHKIEERIQRLVDANAPLDILCDQAHMSVPLTPLPRVLQIWDEWGQKYHKPIEVTEFDVNIADDAVHAKYVHDFLIGAFSDPNIQSFLVWGFWAKAQWLGPSGSLFRADWSPRPAELAYEDLVLKQWRTNATLITGKDGTLQTRGFLGDYDVQVTVGQNTQVSHAVLGKEGLQIKITVQ